MRRLATFVLLGSLIACAHRGVPIPVASDARWKPIASTPGAFRLDVSGAPDRDGAFVYLLKLSASTDVPVHRHSVALRALLRSGSQTIVLVPVGMPSRTITLRPGEAFEIPAGVLHRESFVGASVVELSGIGPVKTERP
jgi:mannose-6-phosphate isomerase-like protein (cupin superfamily)